MDSGDENASVAGIERALVRVRRSQSRRRLGSLAAASRAEPGDAALVPVLDAIDEGSGAHGSEVSVGLVGERLAVDASNASRAVARAVEAGLVARVVSPVDGRRSCLELTPRGRAVVDAVQRQRRAVVADATRTWDEGDRAALARLLGRLMDDFDAALSRRR